MSKKKRITILVGLLLFVVINAYLIWWRRPSPSSREDTPEAAMERRIERQRRRTGWEAYAAISMRSPDLRQYVAEIEDGDCMPGPAGTRRMAFTALSDPVRRDLHDALTEFLQAYASNDPRAIVSMMESRGLVLDLAQVEVLRSMLKARPEFSASDVDDLSPQAVYEELWKAAGFKSSIDAIVIEPSCVTVWSCKDSDAASLRDKAAFTDWLATVWKGIYTPAPTFIPKDDPFAIGTESIGSEGNLVADIQLILENRNVEMEGRSPYLLRLVYNRSESIWQPFILVAILLEDVDVGSLLF